MDELRVRMYNVLFGDAILVSIPDRDKEGKVLTRHILIDVGNVLSGEGGQDTVFEQVIQNVLDVLNGQPLDLYVMTHEHMDHVQGLLKVNKSIFPDHDLKDKLQIQHAWLTASSAPDYLEKHPNSRRKLQEPREAYEEINHFIALSPESLPAAVNVLMANNNPRSTSDCVDYIRTLAKHVWYVHRETNLKNKHPFQESKLEIWAPEEDTSVYYGAFRPVHLAVGPKGNQDQELTLISLTPPSGVDAGAFYNLIEIRRSGYMDNLLAIDKAANNTSLVFCLEWRGWRLLFPGDAEDRSWMEMGKNNLLKPVHFIKVSHHGSVTGAPLIEELDTILPTTSPDTRPRFAALSTYNNTYPGVPDQDTLTEIESRCQLIDTRTAPGGSYVDITFQD